MEFELSQNLNVSFNVQLQMIAIITLGSAKKMKKSMKNAFYFLLVKILRRSPCALLDGTDGPP